VPDLAHVHKPNVGFVNQGSGGHQDRQACTPQSSAGLYACRTLVTSAL
jgi:hypothetical protein